MSEINLLSHLVCGTLAKRIVEIGKIRERIKFIHGCAFDVMDAYLDQRDVCIFLDPPYTAAGKRAGRRLYRYHELDHSQLFSVISCGRAESLFTYDDSAELRKLADKYSFQSISIPMKNTHHNKLYELVIGKNLSWLR